MHSILNIDYMLTPIIAMVLMMLLLIGMMIFSDIQNTKRRAELNEERKQAVKDLHPDRLSLDIESEGSPLTGIKRQYVVELTDHSVISYTFADGEAKPIFKEKRR